MRLTIYLLVSLLFQFECKAQSSPDELAHIIFNELKNGSPEKIITHRLAYANLDHFFLENNIDTSLERIKRYKAQYDQTTEKLLTKCKKISLDPAYTKVAWRKAVVKTITIKTMDGQPLSPERQNETYMVDIRFVNRKKKFVLIFDAIQYPKNVWKIGNMIECLPSKEQLLKPND